MTRTPLVRLAAALVAGGLIATAIPAVAQAAPVSPEPPLAVATATVDVPSATGSGAASECARYSHSSMLLALCLAAHK